MAVKGRRQMDSSFSSVLSKIRSNLSAYRSVYQANERAVRTQLVEPILKAIGWDPGDPNQVLPDPRTDGGIPDYKLVNNNRPVLFVEVKNLSHHLETHEMTQLLRYAFHHGTRYGLLTKACRPWSVMVARRSTRPRICRPRYSAK
jgi:predicted type IV restriction endonuclease